MEHPVVVNPAVPAVQPPLLGLEASNRAPAAVPAVRLVREETAASSGRHARRRYWSVRDLSRRIWLGRGYELLRELVRSGVLRATRSSRNWWIEDADVQGLLAAFEPQAGKVRAFRSLDAWLRERCWVTPLTPETDQTLLATRGGFAWRGRAYLPRSTWRAELGPDGEVTYYHRAGSVVGHVEPQAA